MKHRVATTLVAISFLLSACNPIEWAGDMLEKQAAIKSELEQQHGLSVEVGWHISNGVLTNVDVAIAPNDTDDWTIGELREAIVPVIRKHFDQTPESIMLCLDVSGR